VKSVPPEGDSRRDTDHQVGKGSAWTANAAKASVRASRRGKNRVSRIDGVT
jgi:hypothetical protein